jgi:hypothetical protein
MYKEMEVKYLFLSMKYPSYIKLQTFLVVGWLVAAVLAFVFAKNSQIWFIKNGPWLYPIVALLEIGEAYIAIRKAKSKFDVQPNESTA